MLKILTKMGNWHLTKQQKLDETMEIKQAFFNSKKVIFCNMVSKITKINFGKRLRKDKWSSEITKKKC